MNFCIHCMWKDQTHNTFIGNSNSECIAVIFGTFNDYLLNMAYCEIYYTPLSNAAFCAYMLYNVLCMELF